MIIVLKSSDFDTVLSLNSTTVIIVLINRSNKNDKTWSTLLRIILKKQTNLKNYDEKVENIVKDT